MHISLNIVSVKHELRVLFSAHIFPHQRQSQSHSPWQNWVTKLD